MYVQFYAVNTARTYHYVQQTVCTDRDIIQEEGKTTELNNRRELT